MVNIIYPEMGLFFSHFLSLNTFVDSSTSVNSSRATVCCSLTNLIFLTHSFSLAIRGSRIWPNMESFIENGSEGLPWWGSGWESACQGRGRGFEPWSGKIPHAAEQLGPWATITEPARLEPLLWNKRGRDSERPTHRDEEWPPLATTRESPRTETKTQHSHKLIN